LLGTFDSIQSHDFSSLTIIIFSSVILLILIQILELQTETHYLKICCICRGQVYSNAILVICPFCTAMFHSHHLHKWLRIKNKCPVCLNSFRGFTIKDKTISYNIENIKHPFRLQRSRIVNSSEKIARLSKTDITNFEKYDHHYLIQCVCLYEWFLLSPFIPKFCPSCQISFNNTNHYKLHKIRSRERKNDRRTSLQRHNSSNNGRSSTVFESTHPLRTIDSPVPISHKSLLTKLEERITYLIVWFITVILSSLGIRENVD